MAGANSQRTFRPHEVPNGGVAVAAGFTVGRGRAYKMPLPVVVIGTVAVLALGFQHGRYETRYGAAFIGGLAALATLVGSLLVALFGPLARHQRVVQLAAAVAILEITWLDAAFVLLAGAPWQGERCQGGRWSGYLMPAAVLGGAVALTTLTVLMRGSPRAAATGALALVLFVGWTAALPFIAWDEDKQYIMALRQADGQPVRVLADAAGWLHVYHLLGPNVAHLGTSGAVWEGRLRDLPLKSFGPTDTLYVSFCLGGSYLDYDDGLLHSIAICFD